MKRDAETNAAELFDEDRLADLLAKLDERLSDNGATDDVLSGDLDEESRARLGSLQACLRMIEAARRHAPDLRYSGNGKHLAAKFEIDGQSRVAVWTPLRAEPVFEVDAGGRWLDANFDFTPDGERMVVALADGAVAQFDVVSGNRIASVPGKQVATALALDPSQPRAAVYRNGQIEIVDLANGRTTIQAACNTPVECLAFSPDGRTLASADRVGRVLLWNTGSMKLVSDAQPLMLNYLENADVNQTVHVAFSRRGDVLASTGWDGATRLLDPVHGAPLLSAAGFAAHFSRDDRRLAGGKFGSTVSRWTVAPRREYFVLAQERQMTKIRSLYFDPTNRLIGAATIRGVSVWDLATGDVAGYYPYDNSRGGMEREARPDSHTHCRGRVLHDSIALICKAFGDISRAKLDGSNVIVQFVVDLEVRPISDIAVLPTVPEPSTAALAVVGIARLLTWKRVRRPAVCEICSQ